MKKLFFFMIVAVLVAVAANIYSSDEEFVIVYCEEGSNLYSYNFRVAVKEEGRFGISKKTSRENHPLANKLLEISGVDWVVVHKYAVMVAKGKAYSEVEIRDKVLEVLMKYFKVSNIVVEVDEIEKVSQKPERIVLKKI